MGVAGLAVAGAGTGALSSLGNIISGLETTLGRVADAIARVVSALLRFISRAFRIAFNVVSKVVRYVRLVVFRIADYLSSFYNGLLNFASRNAFGIYLAYGMTMRGILNDKRFTFGMLIGSAFSML